MNEQKELLKAIYDAAVRLEKRWTGPTKSGKVWRNGSTVGWVHEWNSASITVSTNDSYASGPIELMEDAIKRMDEEISGADFQASLQERITVMETIK